MKTFFLFISFGHFLLIISSIPAWARQEAAVEIHDQELSLVQYPAKGEHLILWVAPGYGSHKRAFDMSIEFTGLGIEVWHVDLTESLFLPKSSSSMRGLSGKYVAGLIEYAHRITGKQITLLTRSNGATPVLRGARRWQEKHRFTSAAYLSGAILFSPELYSSVPSLGLEAEYAPITSATNIPIMLYQGGVRGNRWQLETVVDKLQSGGAQVYVKLQPGVTGMFYEKDHAAATLAALQALPGEIENILNLLQKTPTPKRPAHLAGKEEKKHTGLDVSLKPYKGNPTPAALDLMSIDGTRVTRKNYSGKVTVVNFWATWCPPCVEEIPSLNNLRQKMSGQAFELISVNYAEDKSRINTFMQKVDVNFPVLLDESGKVSAEWNVLVFPSTFVIDSKGKIRYGVNAAIHWDTPEVVEMLQQLINEQG